MPCPSVGHECGKDPKQRAFSNPVDYRISIFGFPTIPRFLGKNGNHSRQLAKAVEMGKIVENLGKTRLFLLFLDTLDKLGVGGSSPSTAHSKQPVDSTCQRVVLFDGVSTCGDGPGRPPFPRSRFNLSRLTAICPVCR